MKKLDHTYLGELEWRKVRELKEHPRNPKKHTGAQISSIKESILRFGWTQPVVIDEYDTILIGHGRTRAAPNDEVPTIVARGLSEQEKDALLVLDNHIASETGFNATALESAIRELNESGYNLSNFGILGPEDSTIEAQSAGEKDRNTLKKQLNQWERAETKPMIFYYTADELDDVEKRIKNLMEEEEITTRSGLLDKMLEVYLHGN